MFCSFNMFIVCINIKKKVVNNKSFVYPTGFEYAIFDIGSREVFLVKIVNPSVEIMTPIDGNQVLKHLELCCRNCYQSEGLIEDGSAERMLNKIMHIGHTSVLEHFSITVRVIADTGVLKDITRHRICSFAVESTRYCCYNKDKFGKEITVMNPVPVLFASEEDEGYRVWLSAIEEMEKSYLKLADMGFKPDVCRMLLPHSTKSSIIMTANIREWRHIFSLRCAKAAHPTVRQIMIMILAKFSEAIPVVFDDLAHEFLGADNADTDKN